MKVRGRTAHIQSLALCFALLSSGVPALDCDGDGSNDALGFGIFQDCDGNDWPDKCDLACTFLVPGTVFDAPSVHSLTTTDLDADGDVDIAAIGSRDEAYIILNNGFGSFPVCREYALRTYSGWVSAADLEGDGDKDLFFHDAGERIQSLVNGGAATFSRGVEIVLGSRSIFTFGDLDGDGNLDIAAGDPSVAPVELVAFINDGGGVREPSIIGPTITTRSLTIADLDLDGSNDLALATALKAVVFLNAEGLSFQILKEYNVGSDPRGIVAGDVDGDGDPDLLTTNTAQEPGTANNVSLLANAGDGTFAVPRNFGAALKPHSVKLRDLDGDQDLDVIGIGFDDREVTVLWNDGFGQLDQRESWRIHSHAGSLDVGDLDGDGDLDVVTNPGGLDHEQIVVVPNLGNGRFQSPRFELLDGTAVALAAGDLDGDGDVDLASAGTGSEGTGQLRVYRNEGGGLHTSMAHEIPREAVDLLAVDLDADHDRDLFVTVPLESVLLVNDDVGNFRLSNIIERNEAASDSLAADLDSDGLPDIVTTRLNAITVLFNRGNAMFAEPQHHDLGYTPSSIDAADFDGDGKVDLAAAGFKTLEGGKLSLLRNTGGRILSVSHAPLGISPDEVVAGDLDSDGSIDCVMLDLDKFFVLKGNGNATFADGVRYHVKDSVETFALEDIDSDGDRDIVLALSSEAEVALFFNAGDGSFETVLHRPAGHDPLDVLAADLDGDGDKDIAIGNRDAGLFVLENLIQPAKRDCNGNGILDSCDLTVGLLADVNDDGLADDCGGPLFRRGDVDASGEMSITDAIIILLRLFSGGEALPCARSADANDDATLDLTDAILILRFLFLVGAAPSAPFPDCGADPTPDDLGCRATKTCI